MDAGANAGLLDTTLLDTINWTGLLNTLNIICERAKQQKQKETLNNPLNPIGGYFPIMGVEHVNTTAAQQREALATRRAVDSESTDGGEEVVGGSMVGGAMEGGGDGGGSGGVRSEAPALADVARTTATLKDLKALEELLKGEGDFADTLTGVRSGLGSFPPQYQQDAFLKWMQSVDIQVNRPATLCKQCAIYSLQCVADSLGTACQRRVLVISI